MKHQADKVYGRRCLVHVERLDLRLYVWQPVVKLTRLTEEEIQKLQRQFNGGSEKELSSPSSPPSLASKRPTTTTTTTTTSNKQRKATSEQTATKKMINDDRSDGKCIDIEDGRVVISVITEKGLSSPSSSLSLASKQPTKSTSNKRKAMGEQAAKKKKNNDDSSDDKFIDIEDGRVVIRQPGRRPRPVKIDWKLKFQLRASRSACEEVDKDKLGESTMPNEEPAGSSSCPILYSDDRADDATTVENSGRIPKMVMAPGRGQGPIVPLAVPVIFQGAVGVFDTADST